MIAPLNPLERTVLRELFSDKAFADRVAPCLKDKYFFSESAKCVFRLYHAFFVNFHTVPPISAIRIGVDSLPALGQKEVDAVQDVLTMVEEEPSLADAQKPWGLKVTEEWVQERALYCAVQESVAVINNPKEGNAQIIETLKEALAISFDTNIGHDYFADSDLRYDFYHAATTKLPFDLDLLNRLTNGGVTPKTLNLMMAGTNVGKSLALCHFAAAYTRMNKHVLYVSCEMSTERIGERIDANLMDIPIDDVHDLPHADYMRKMDFLKRSSSGRLIIKEYPTATCTVDQHLRPLLLDLRLKRNFVPDVILVDYLTICASSRIKLNHGSVNSYSYNKYIAEELRGLSQEFNVPLWSAAQFNRTGFVSTEPGLEHMGESFGIATTSDFCAALVTTEELEQLGQVSLTVLKNRYGPKTKEQFLLGIDTTRMKLYELNAAAFAPRHVVKAPQPSVSSFSRPSGRRTPMASLKSETASAHNG